MYGLGICRYTGITDVMDINKCSLVSTCALLRIEVKQYIDRCGIFVL